MKTIIVALMCLLLGFGVGYLMQWSEFAGRLEDAVRREMVLLMRFPVPPCDKVMAKSDMRVSEAQGGDQSLWFYEKSSDRLRRVVVSPDLVVGYEEMSLGCKQR
ncbi:hypothetical protein HCH_01568 [Hahella chejuensis KCTC 2396]|uniref:Uncharacterized protein n=1 Tax=Hahella chejuensis (strain KCTC 2396) TaxID=349521 RepID=Q2SLP9_HAHCH|nr:hypothetical protein [Hahella chejuensis]ABC28425.1 hypothetical protein HCH_01568 [Hahella chejuensis KCTC 2396]